MRQPSVLLLAALTSSLVSGCVIDRAALVSILAPELAEKATNVQPRGQVPSKPSSALPGAPAAPGTSAPVISSLTPNPTTLPRPGQSVSIQISAYDPKGQSLRYTWSATGGTLSSTSGTLITWRAPETAGTYTVVVLVTNDAGGSASSSLNVVVGQDGSAVVGTPSSTEPGPRNPADESSVSGGEGSQVEEALPVVVIEPGASFNDLFFTSASSGWVVGGDGGHGVVRHTTDAGSTWTNQDIGGQELTAIAFATPSMGWVGGKNGVLYKTIDGGAHWSKQSLSTGATVTGLYFADPARGFLTTSGVNAMGLTDGGLFTTTDGGETWKLAVKGQFKRAQGTANGTIFTNDGIEGLKRFKDGGLSKTVPFASLMATVSSSPYSPSILLAGNLGGQNVGAQDLYASKDGGQTWSKQTFHLTDERGLLTDANNAGWSGLAMTSDREAIGILGRVVVETIDGGSTWSAIASLERFPHAVLPRFFAFDRRHAWGVLDGSHLVRMGAF